jgi:hypothetical protein
MKSHVDTPLGNILVPVRTVRRALDTFQQVSHAEASGGLVLVARTALAVLWAVADYQMVALALRSGPTCGGGHVVPPRGPRYA